MARVEPRRRDLSLAMLFAAFELRRLATFSLTSDGLIVADILPAGLALLREHGYEYDLETGNGIGNALARLRELTGMPADGDVARLWMAGRGAL